MLIYILFGIVYGLMGLQYTIAYEERFKHFKYVHIVSIIVGLLWPILFILTIFIVPIKYFKECFSKKDDAKDNTDDHDDCYTEFQRQKCMEIDDAMYKAVESLISSDLMSDEPKLYNPDIITLRDRCLGIIIGYLRTNGYVVYYPHKNDFEGSDHVIETYEPYNYFNIDICEGEENEDEHCGE